MRITEARDYHEPRDSISHDWIDALCGWGMEPILIPNSLTDTAGYLKSVSPDLLILTGGESPGETLQRDESETRLLAEAERFGRPVLGVCRGMQLMAQRAGGVLIPIQGHVAEDHAVSIAAPLKNIYGDRMSVNSYHTLGLEKDAMGEGFRAVATDQDGRVEAMVHRQFPLAAIMWHPEREGAPAADCVFIETLASEGAFWLDQI